MKAKLMAEERAAGARVFLLVLDPDEEAVAALTGFAKLNDLRAGHFSGIGSFRHATLAWFSPEETQYKHIPIDDQVEVLSLAGNISMYEGAQRVHAHVTLGRRDGTALGGHLLEGFVRPTLEVIIYELPAGIERKNDEETGLSLIRL